LALEPEFQSDIASIGRIASVPTMLDVICRITGMGFAAVARVTSDRWIACSVKDDIAFGLQPGGELDVQTTICHEIRQSGKAVVIDHVADEPDWRVHHTPLKYGFQSYISMPIVRADGAFFGTLCAVDPRPAKLNTPEVIGMFKLFAELIAHHLDAEERITAIETSLAQERETAQLREQFIAVLGHDLRSPLAAIDGGTRLLGRIAKDEKSVTILSLMQNSVKRMSGLIVNVMDFARGRMGGGLPINREPSEALGATLLHVVEELRTAWPSRTIEAAIAVDRAVTCDAGRISQLLSNLVSNALTHGSDTEPVRVTVATAGDAFELSVSNSGDPIPTAALERLFSPFTRGEVRPSQEGLGLGLYIASEIARAHGGALTVESSDAETRFTFRMPRG